MDNQEYIVILYDYYGELLSDKQREYFELYYFDNLSLQEIADNHNISKNAVSKALKEAKNNLEYYESILKLIDNNNKIKNILSEDVYLKIEKYI